MDPVLATIIVQSVNAAMTQLALASRALAGHVPTRAELDAARQSNEASLARGEQALADLIARQNKE